MSTLIGTLGSGVSALRTFMKGLEVIGNNIANVNTSGYKSSSAAYSDTFSNILQRSAPSSATATNTEALAVGTGVKLGGISTNFSQGSLQTTGRSSDLGVSGEGYFHVKNSGDGTEFVTRDGSFRWDDQGKLVNSQGYRVQGLTGDGLGTVGDITLGTPPVGAELQSVSFDKNGNVIEFYSDGSSATTNQVLLQNFTDQSALVKEGSNLFSGMLAAGPVGAASGSFAFQVGTGNAPGANGLGSIQSGTVELSNVDLTEQFSSLITTQRSFQAGSRLITVSDTILEDIVNLKR
ncbi:MAG: flagellar hook-basal body complex protein [Opitutaceae bacterium]|jgi:flagellar hook protein FlgE